MDAKLDAKRLEELAALATSESKYFTYRGPCTEQDLRDLARCAAAWAKVERRRRKGKWQLGLVCGCATLSSGYSGGFPTAIAAVEAAPEVTDANKG